MPLRSRPARALAVQREERLHVGVSRPGGDRHVERACAGWYCVPSSLAARSRPSFAGRRRGWLAPVGRRRCGAGSALSPVAPVPCGPLISTLRSVEPRRVSGTLLPAGERAQEWRARTSRRAPPSGSETHGDDVMRSGSDGDAHVPVPDPRGCALLVRCPAAAALRAPGQQPDPDAASARRSPAECPPCTAAARLRIGAAAPRPRPDRARPGAPHLAA